MIIKNGTIATADMTFCADIFIEDEKIAAIGKDLDSAGQEVIDASGCYVVPGGIDVHTHMNIDVGAAIATDDFYTGTVAAACGGTTAIVDHMGFGPAGCPLEHQLNYYHELADDKAVIDFGFHGVIQHVDDDVLKKMASLIEEGLTSYKIYLTYGYKLNDDDVYKILTRCKELGLMVTVHPENDGVVNYLRADFVKHNKTSPKYHPLSRPAQCEAEAINRMLLFASMAGDAPLYIVHLSCALGLEFIEAAKARGQRNVYTETCPQYLFLSDDKYELPGHEGLKYIMSPPLRTKRDNELLWRAVSSGKIDTIATDHCPFFFHKEKQQGKDDFTKCPNGAPGVETRMPLMFGYGVKNKLITVNQMVDLCATKPAKLFGLYPNKGTIAVGADADIVLLDPNKKVRLTKQILHENVDYTPYEGIVLEGYPVMTISRGEVIVRNGEFTGKKGRGNYIKRKKSILETSE